VNLLPGSPIVRAVLYIQTLNCLSCINHSRAPAFTWPSGHTTDQMNYHREAAKAKAIAFAWGEFDKMFGEHSRNSKHLTITRSSSPYRPRKVEPTYSESRVDSELKCPACGFLFQLYGVFGFCPGCNAENMLIYDANISIIRKTTAIPNAPGSLKSARPMRIRKAGRCRRPTPIQG